MFSFDEAEALAILMRTITLNFGVSVLSAIRADPKDGTIVEVVGTRLAPGAVGVSEIGYGVDVTEMGAEFAIGNEEGDIVVVTQDVLDTLIGVGLRESIDG